MSTKARRQRQRSNSVPRAPQKPKTRSKPKAPMKKRSKPKMRKDKTVKTNRPPKFAFPSGNRQGTGFASAASRKRVLVKESEYIGEVTVASQPNFNIAYNLPINPGQASTFPWLSTIAKQYEKYCFKQLEFIFRPEVTQFTAGTNTGKVVLSCDYDASDSPPGSKQAMEDTDPHADGMPYETIVLRLSSRELGAKSDAKFVRPAGVPGGTDVKTYDGGNFFLATQGQTSNSIVGELHVNYVVELSIPVLENAISPPNNNSVTLLSQAGQAITSGVNANMLFNHVVYDGLGVTNNAGSIQLPAGNYLIDIMGQFIFNGTTGELGSIELTINGSSQFPTAVYYETGAAGNTFDFISGGWSTFVSVKPTDVIVIIAEAIGSSNIAVAGTIRIVSI